MLEAKTAICEKREKYLPVLRKATCDIMLTWYKLLESKTVSTNFTWLYFKMFDSFLFAYFNLNVSYSVCLFVCLLFNGLLQSICYRMFSSKHSITFEKTYLLSCWFDCVDLFRSNLNSVELSQQQIPGQEFHWLKHFLILQLLSVDLCMF